MRKPNILVVEDDDDIRDALVELLEQQGFRVAQASNGEEGLALLKDLHPCLVLLDLVMPKMDGPAFVAELRQGELLLSIPVAVMTARAAPPPLEFAKDTIKKPFEFEELMRVVRAHCGETSHASSRPIS